MYEYNFYYYFNCIIMYIIVSHYSVHQGTQILYECS